MSHLYVVATPIGNLEDITYRAVETLKKVSLIACEDTRHSLKLLNHLGIHTKLISCHSQNEEQAATKILSALESGEEVAYISDAGTPAVSDPGARLCKIVRNAGFPITPIPGASAITTLISVASITGKSFTFLGFLSPKSGKRRKTLETYMIREDSFILYESPFRILKLITEIADISPERQLFIGRELTKSHEEFLEGSAKELLEELSKRDSIKGELIILVSGAKKG